MSEQKQKPVNSPSQSALPAIHLRTRQRIPFSPTSQSQQSRHFGEAHTAIQRLEGTHEFALPIQSPFLQRTAVTPVAAPPPSIPSSGGQPLELEVRRSYEQILGHSFDDVSIHTDSAAHEAAQQLNALAFTTQKHIYFGAGNFAPGTPAGDKLLAHELIHVAQDKEGRVPRHVEQPVSQPDDPLEQEAYQKENKVVEAVGLVQGKGADYGQTATPRDLPSGGNAKIEEATTATVDLPSPTPVTEPTTSEKHPTQASLPTEKRVEHVRPKPMVPAFDAQKPAEMGMSAEPPPKTRRAKLPQREPVPMTPLTIAEETIKPQPIEPTTLAAMERPFEIRPVSQESSPLIIQRSPDNQTTVDDGSAIAKAEAQRIEAESQNIAQGINAQVTAAQTTIQMAQARLVAVAEADWQEAQQQVTLSFAAEAQNLQAQADTTLAQIMAEKTAQLALLSATVAQEQARFQAIYEAQEQEAITFVEELKQALLTASEQEATRVVQASEARAAGILDEATHQSFGSEEGLAEAQQKAVQDIAAKAAQECRRTGAETAVQVRSEAVQHLQSYDTPLQDYLAQRQTTYQETNQSLQSLATFAQQQIEQAATGSCQAVQEAMSQSQEALITQKEQALQQIAQWHTQAIGSLSQLSDQWQAGFTAQLGVFTGALQGYAGRVAGQLRSVERPVLEDVIAFASSVHEELASNQQTALATINQGVVTVETGLSSAYEGQKTGLAGLLSSQQTAVQTIGTGFIQVIQEAGPTATTGMTQISAQTQTELVTAVDDAITELTQAQTEFSAQLQEPHQQALTALSGMVNEALTSEDQLISDAQSQMASAISQISSEYSSLKAQADTLNNNAQATTQPRIHRFLGLENLWNAFTEWLDSVRQWFIAQLGEYVGGLVFGLLSALVLVLVGVALVALVALVSEIAAVVLVVVLLVVGIGLLIYNRFNEFMLAHQGQGPNWWQAIGLTLLGILDITGIPFIIEGIVGQTITGLDLNDATAGERLGGGIVALAAFVFSVFKGVKWIRSRNAPVDPATTPVETAVEPPTTRITQPTFNNYEPGSGFSGVYDPETGQFIIRPSGNTPAMPGGEGPTWVEQFGGHGTLNESLAELAGTNPNKTAGFVLIYEGEGRVTIRWNSGSVNVTNFGQRAVPAELRPAIINAIESQTGLSVTSSP